MAKYKLGDKINRGFIFLVVVLGLVMVMRFAFAVFVPAGQVQLDQVEYPETQDNYAETVNALDIPIEWVDSTLLQILAEDTTGEKVRAFLPLDSAKLQQLINKYCSE